MNSLRELVQLPHNRSCASLAESVAGVVGFENAQTLQAKAFERFMRSQSANTGLVTLVRSCEAQNHRRITNKGVSGGFWRRQGIWRKRATYSYRKNS